MRETKDFMRSGKTFNIILAQHKAWIDSNGETGERADFSNADLSNMDLQGLYFFKVNLHAANLRGSVLSKANFRNADLSGADMSETLLIKANLTESDLSGANLGKSRLRDAKLNRAILRGTDLSDADMTGADLREIKNFTESKGWESAKLKDSLLNFDARNFLAGINKTVL